MVKYCPEGPLLAESGPSILPIFGYLNVRFREKQSVELDPANPSQDPMGCQVVFTS